MGLMAQATGREEQLATAAGLVVLADVTSPMMEQEKAHRAFPRPLVRAHSD
jgi:hypothetical protein